MINVMRMADPMILIIVISMLGLGLLGIMSAGIHLNSNPYYFVGKQLLFSVAGLGFLICGALIDYTRYRYRVERYFVTGVILLLSVFIFGQNRSWIPLPFIHLQPSEPAKLIIIIYLAYMNSFDRGETLRFWQHSLPMMVTCGLLIVATAMQPDFGTAMVMTIITVYLLLIGSVPLSHLVIPGLVTAPFAVIIPIMFPHVMKRLTNFLILLDPRTDPSQLSYHDLQLHLAMGSGGLFGTGFGHGLIKRSFLPASHTDSIYAVLVEEGGLIIGFVIVILYLAFFLLGERTARSAYDNFGAMLARGITFYLCVQAFLNISVCLGLFPNTGVTLPFFSYGGSSIIVSLFAIGILINISSQRQIIY
jgi:cell division protein FtsW